MSANTIQSFHLPPYHEIPDVGLYLDQVTRYINDSLQPLGQPTVTSSMLSNYVKKGYVASCLWNTSIRCSRSSRAAIQRKTPMRISGSASNPCWLPCSMKAKRRSCIPGTLTLASICWRARSFRRPTVSISIIAWTTIRCPRRIRPAVPGNPEQNLYPACGGRYPAGPAARAQRRLSVRPFCASPRSVPPGQGRRI